MTSTMVYKTRFKWEIPNFSKTKSSSDSTRKLESNVFTLNDRNMTFYLRFRHSSVSGNDKYCSIHLMLGDLDGDESVNVKYNLWIENNYGEIIKPHADRIYTFTPTNKWDGHREFVERKRLCSSKRQFAKDDVVFICCKIHRTLPVLNNVSEQQRVIDIAKKEWELFEQGFSDLCIIQVDNQEFKVAKNKLMASSSVFESMFQADMKEGKLGLLRIEKTSPTAIKDLIKYLYIRELKDAEDVILELYSLADKYQIDDLKTNCSRILVTKLNKKNILDRLSLAFMHKDVDLKRGVLDYLSNRNFKLFMKSVEWKKFAAENDELSNEIVDEVFKVMNWN